MNRRLQNFIISLFGWTFCFSCVFALCSCSARLLVCRFCYTKFPSKVLLEHYQDFSSELLTQAKLDFTERFPWVRCTLTWSRVLDLPLQEVRGGMAEFHFFQEKQLKTNVINKCLHNTFNTVIQCFYTKRYLCLWTNTSWQLVPFPDLYADFVLLIC